MLYKGEAPPYIFRIKSGLVRAYSIGKNGEEKTVSLFSGGDLFPVGYLFDLAPVALFYYDTLSQVSLEIHEKEQLKTATKSLNSDDLVGFARHQLSAMLHANAVSQTKARDRVLYIMQYLAIRFGEPMTGKVYTRINIRLTQQDIARLAGLTRETTAIEIGKLKKEEIIDIKSQHYLVRQKKINAAVEEDMLGTVTL